MYCPKCGGENSADLAYCRSCGENLKIISQAMSGNAPLAIANKIEEALSSNTFRLKRDAIWFGIAGVVATIATIIGGPLLFTSQIVWLQTLGMILLPALLFVFSGREYLAYRRSLEKKRPLDVGDSRNPELPEARYDAEPRSRDDHIFCPACGIENPSDTQFCRNCGGTLAFGSTGMERYLPRSVIRHLDTRIASYEEIKRPHKSLKTTMLVAGLFILNAVFQSTSGITLASGLNLFTGLTFLVLGTWDHLTFRRTHPSHVENEEPTFFYYVGSYFSDPERNRKGLTAFAILVFLNLGAFVWLGERAFGFLFLSILAGLAGLLLNFKLYQWRVEEARRPKEISWLSDIELRETDHLGDFLHQQKSLPEVEVAHFDSENVPTGPFSVTESPTRQLLTENTPDLEHAATTRKLDNEGS